MKETDIKKIYKIKTFFAFLNWTKYAIKVIIDGDKIYDMKDVKNFEDKFFKNFPSNHIERIFKNIFIVLLPIFLFILIRMV